MAFYKPGDTIVGGVNWKNVGDAPITPYFRLVFYREKLGRDERLSVGDWNGRKTEPGEIQRMSLRVKVPNVGPGKYEGQLDMKFDGKVFQGIKKSPNDIYIIKEEKPPKEEKPSCERYAVESGKQWQTELGPVLFSRIGQAKAWLQRCVGASIGGGYKSSIWNSPFGKDNPVYKWADRMQKNYSKCSGFWKHYEFHKATALAAKLVHDTNRCR